MYVGIHLSRYIYIDIYVGMYVYLPVYLDMCILLVTIHVHIDTLMYVRM